VFVLVFVRVHGCAKSNEIVSGLLVLDTEVSGSMDFSGQGRIALVPQHPVDDHGMVLVGFEEPFLMRGQWSPIFLVGTGMKRAGVKVAVEAHAGFEEGVWPLNAIVDEGGEFLTAFAVRNGKEMPRRMRELLEATLKVPLPARARVDAGLWLPVFLVFV
jgi:hypothetical protein